jgi:EAL domain-containing protein (putative c-di-GMP-specific phosphodiesterase class I)
MYEAKAAGRARAEFYDVRAHSGFAQRKELVAEMHAGLERGEFFVVYQPIVRLRGGRLVGYEALLRWQHPRLGLLTPARFLSTATVSGTIVGLGRFVLVEAIRRLADLQREGTDAVMHVNLSVPEIMQPELDAFLESTLQSANVSPASLVLEITENSIVESNFTSRRMFERLRRLGVGLTVDDFGVGYSSLRYLNDLPVTGIKIDGSFVRGVGGELASEPIVRMLVELARSLDLSLIAECVETRQQLDALVRLGCVVGQGYLLGEPLPAPVNVAANW